MFVCCILMLLSLCPVGCLSLAFLMVSDLLSISDFPYSNNLNIIPIHKIRIKSGQDRFLKTRLDGQANIIFKKILVQKVCIITIFFRYCNLKMKSNRRIQNCDKNNQQKQFNCLHQFISSQLQCTFPWSSKDSTAATVI